MLYLYSTLRRPTSKSPLTKIEDSFKIIILIANNIKNIDIGIRIIKKNFVRHKKISKSAKSKKQLTK
jgi:hypothetical protein